ncbi:cytochrome c biogenesis protein ResB [Gordonia jinhuaensis]|uniref:Cytochrome c biogenesis protein n=1 Tax=Gordonia jinhuaensis TaxID=1517702 RepID=A0A916SXA0_9ACTN|nr:cytochrome c biogenesis protein ResB [Gordonia jinhuaensis]GGB21628.1 cytochrome c biogenesis protein [Gordonia jinhuaensis]
MTDLDVKPPQQTPPPRPAKPHVLIRRVWWPVRNLWRSLTAMRTALALLFLLALAAVPGALLPQRELNEAKTAKYIADHGLVGRILDRLQFFEVFSSVWFTAIYVLLFVSLVGCLTPRMIEQARTLRARPVRAPRRFDRLPRHVRYDDSDADPIALGEQVMSRLRGWRKAMRVTLVGSTGTETFEVGADGLTDEQRANVAAADSVTVEVSAEKGYLREFGNLLFHFALLGLLVAIAVGKVYGYEGTRIVVADGTQPFCNTSTAVYDSFRGGGLVDGTDLTPFCVNVQSFDATYLPSGQPDMYTARVHYQKASQLDSQNYEDATIKVNHPLRTEGDRVYVLGNGFAPTFTVTFPNGESRTQTVPFRPDELSIMLSSGAVRFDTPAGLYPNPDERRKHQVALEGLFAPTATLQGTLLSSAFPEPRNPAVAIDIYQGDTGLDTGAPQNVYELDRDMINQGRLLKKDRVNLGVGQQSKLPDGTTVRFDGYQRWVSLQVSHNPAQEWVLISAIAMLVGLLISLLIKRRRVWARISGPVPESAGDQVPESADDQGPKSAGDSAPAAQRHTVVELAGLARTDQAGWGEGFPKFAAGLVGRDEAATDAQPGVSERARNN